MSAAPPEPASAGAYRRRVVASLRWNASGEMVAQSIRFTFGIVLARLLSPTEFGKMAMVTVVVQFVIANADLGFEEALIQRQEVDESHRSSVFWTLLLAAVLLMLVLIASAPWVARWYGVDQVAPIVIAAAPAPLLAVLGSIPRVVLSRRLDFRVIASRWCVAVALSGASAVTCAWLGFGVFSLVVGLLVSVGVESILLWIASGWRPSAQLRASALRELAGFSLYRPGARTLNYWAQRIDQLLVGKLLGSDALGLYARAFNVTRFPVMSVSRVIVDVMFPSLAIIQQDAERVRAVYLRTCGAVTLASVPMALGLFATAEPFVIGVLGAQWREAIPILRILSLLGLFQSLTNFATSVCLSQGRADLVFRLSIAQRLTTIVAVVLALRWGVLAVAAAQLLSTALNALPTLYFTGTLVNLGLRRVLAALAPIFLAGVVMAGAVLGADHHLAGLLATPATLVLEIGIGILTYWATLLILRPAAYRDLLEFLRQPR